MNRDDFLFKDHFNTFSFKKVLLVEDDVICQEVITLFLRNRYQVDCAETADEAIKKIKRTDYCAILLDINLGFGKNGLAVLKEIKNQPNNANVPIIAQTAYALKSDKEKILAAGCDFYLAKPFCRKELIGIFELINNTISQK